MKRRPVHPPRPRGLACGFGSFAVLAVAGALSSCQAPGAAPVAMSPSSPTSAIPISAAPSTGVDAEAALLSHIRDEIGDARCHADNECRSLPVGAKACGGPAAWWPWSTSRSDGARLRVWALDLERLQRERLERSGERSNCQVVPDPGAACVALRCVLNARGRAA